MAFETGTRAPEFRYRPDVDGLRAVAILSVIVFHATPNFLPGGFVGVDIFFVISGFLISSLILNDLQAGQFSYATFYARRIRRLFPALIVVLLGTWLLGLLTLLPVELTALARHMIAAAAFAGNILNFAEAGYFDMPAIAKPLLHLWSLGVEEQFYLVFPALLIGLWRYRRVRLCLVAVGLASFALNIALVRDHSSFTFYLPFTRFWEFVAGALLAPGFVHGRGGGRAISQSLSSAMREACAVAGIGMIAVAVVITGHEGFPGWMAALPVLGAALIIAAGPNAWLNRVLANPKLVYIGLISYPLYLWHWPLIVAGRNIMSTMPNPRERTTAIVAVALAFVLAALTYRFIERPIREGRALPALRRSSFRLAGGLAAVALLAAGTAQMRGFLFAYPPAVQALLAPLPFTADGFGDAAMTGGPLLVTYGDSHSGHLQPGLTELHKQHPFRMMALTWGRCSPLGDKTPDPQETCDRLHAENERRLAGHKPDVVVIAAFWSFYRDVGKLGDAVRAFRALGASRIVVVGSVPYWPRPPQQILYRAYRDDQDGRIPDRLAGFDGNTVNIDKVLEAIASANGATYVSAHDVLCNEDGCLARLGDRAADIVQVDRTHLSDAGSRYFVDRIAARIFDRSPAPSEQVAATDNSAAN